MQVKAGTRLKSQVCETQVVVVRAAADEVELTCGGAPLVALDAEPAAGAALDQSQAGGTLLGKRYADEDLGIELLCTKAGQGSLAVNGRALGLKQAKALPASD
ncbi:MAG TPA: hypothetical protein VGI06_06210 [Acidimicrobiales bacterium]